MYACTVPQQDFFLYVPDSREQLQLSGQKRGGAQKEQFPPVSVGETSWQEVFLTAELTIYTYRYDEDK